MTGLPAFIVPGARVEWTTWCGPAQATVAHVDRFHVTLQHDGSTIHGGPILSGLDATCYRTLPQVCAHLRPAPALTTTNPKETP